MYVKNRMTKHPICIDVNSKISDVVDIMSEKELHRIPVISGKKLVGLDFQKGCQQGNQSEYL